MENLNDVTLQFEFVICVSGSGSAAFILQLIYYDITNLQSNLFVFVSRLTLLAVMLL